MTGTWTAACLQIGAGSVKDAADAAEARTIRTGLLARYDALLRGVLGQGDVDLFCFPEYMFGTCEPDLRGVLDFDGPEIERLQAMARDYKVFISAGGYTRDPRFPGRYFNTYFLFGRDGEILIRYYRIFTYHSVSPHDFWDRYIDTVGLEGAFPVARTELGNIAILSSMEMLFPELARAYTLRGAEVLLHATAEKMVDLSVKRTRAVENMAYVLSANLPNKGPDAEMDVGSVMVDWRGRVFSRCEQGAESVCRGTVDIDALRRGRTELFGAPPNPVNLLARLRTEIVRDVYAATPLYPMDLYQEGQEITRSITPDQHPERLFKAREQMVRHGMLMPQAAEAEQA